MVNFKNSLCGVGYLYATVNETRGDWICQKLQKIWDSPYLKADLTKFHKNWYKKQGSWVKDEGQWLTSTVVARELAFFVVSSLDPNFYRSNQKGPDHTCTENGLCSRKGTWIIYDEQLSFALKQTLSSSSKAVHYINILKRMDIKG